MNAGGKLYNMLYFDVDSMYPFQIKSEFHIALDMYLDVELVYRRSILGLNWASREIEKQFTRVWKEFKEILEVF